ncbi:MAG: hypothetical protein L0Z50_33575 [Verrucomicrobiales bacterium]|nr:hypothetical protein [Verrucomicrobiales bacterium]
MKTSIVADGPRRFATSKEYQARCRELQQSIAARYAARFAEAGFFQRLRLRYLRHREFLRELRVIAPSPHSLWFGVLTPRREGDKREEQIVRSIY